MYTDLLSTLISFSLSEDPKPLSNMQLPITALLTVLLLGITVAAPLEPRDGTICAFVDWVEGGQPSELVDVGNRCQHIDQDWEELGLKHRRRVLKIIKNVWCKCYFWR